jgi:catechol 2,3-dioxygenase-like lactoylglutathione lyase family enzyme
MTILALLALAQVAPPAERVPTDIRRTTIIVESLERSLKLYRDVLGMKVNYDAVVKMSGVALPAGKPGSEARLVLLNANDGFVRWIGLIEWVKPPLPKRKRPRERLGVGDVVLVTNTDDADRRCGLAKSVPGVRFTAEPHTSEYPGRNGGPPIRVRGCNFFDPDGILVELNQILR